MAISLPKSSTRHGALKLELPAAGGRCCSGPVFCRGPQVYPGLPGEADRTVAAAVRQLFPR